MAGPKERGSNGGTSETAMRVDTDMVRKLAELLSENDLTEIEVEDGDRKIKVAREPAPQFGPQFGSAPAAQPAAPALSGPPVIGFGALSYVLALDAAAHLCKGAAGTQAKSQIQ